MQAGFKSMEFLFYYEWEGNDSFGDEENGGGIAYIEASGRSLNEYIVTYGRENPQ
jgi:hypothetical protein